MTHVLSVMRGSKALFWRLQPNFKIGINNRDLLSIKHIIFGDHHNLMEDIRRGRGHGDVYILCFEHNHRRDPAQDLLLNVSI